MATFKAGIFINPILLSYEYRIILNMSANGRKVRLKHAQEQDSTISRLFNLEQFHLLAEIIGLHRYNVHVGTYVVAAVPHDTIMPGLVQTLG